FPVDEAAGGDRRRQELAVRRKSHAARTTRVFAEVGIQLLGEIARIRRSDGATVCDFVNDDVVPAADGQQLGIAGKCQRGRAAWIYKITVALDEMVGVPEFLQGVVCATGPCR